MKQDDIYYLNGSSHSITRMDPGELHDILSRPSKMLERMFGGWYFFNSSTIRRLPRDTTTGLSIWLRTNNLPPLEGMSDARSSDFFFSPYGLLRLMMSNFGKSYRFRADYVETLQLMLLRGVSGDDDMGRRELVSLTKRNKSEMLIGYGPTKRFFKDFSDEVVRGVMQPPLWLSPERPESRPVKVRGRHLSKGKNNLKECLEDIGVDQTSPVKEELHPLKTRRLTRKGRIHV